MTCSHKSRCTATDGRKNYTFCGDCNKTLHVADRPAQPKSKSKLWSEIVKQVRKNNGGPFRRPKG